MKTKNIIAENLKIHFGSEIKKARKEANLSQDAFAKLIGYSSKVSVSAIENGRESISLTTLGKICEVLNLDFIFKLQKK